MRLAEQAGGLTQGTDVDMLDTLAAAYAEVGDFEEAIAMTNRALELAQKAQAAELVARITARRALYARKQPYRQP